MSTKTIVQKLLIKPGNKVILIDPPHGYIQSMGNLPEHTSFIEINTQPADVIQVFVNSLETVLQNVELWKQSMKPRGILWITYPKGTSKVKTDLNRDILWLQLKVYHLEGVAIVAVDEIWSAMRFKII